MSAGRTGILHLHTPGGRYAQWGIYYLPHNDTYQIKGVGVIAGDDWEVIIAAHMMIRLGDPNKLLHAATQFADAGLPPTDFIKWAAANAAGPWSGGPSAAQLAQLQAHAQSPLPHTGGGPPVINSPLDDAPLFQKPQRVETEIIAYRAWYLDWEVLAKCDDSLTVRPVLHSTNRECVWEGPTTRAHQVPGATDKCGLYAVGVETRFGANFNNFVTQGNVWGEVSLSGIVVEGEIGYRAERATIRRLWVGGAHRINMYIEPFTLLAQMLADRYQCDVGGQVVEPSMDRARQFYEEATKGGT